MILPALQKFYNALKHIKHFSLENSFFDNVGSIDIFLSEYRSVTLVLQTSLGGRTNPVYQKNLSEYLLKDERIAKWLNEKRVTVVHQHPFSLKKVLRIVIYQDGNALEYKRFEQTIDNDKQLWDYQLLIRNTFSSVVFPEINFSVQYIFVDKEDEDEINIFDLIDPGIIAMWRFLHAMKSDLSEEDDTVNKLMKEIDGMVISKPQRWVFDALDYCYYRTTDSFERGELATLLLPDVRTPVTSFVNIVQKTKAPISDFYDAFIWMHSCMYIMQNHEIMNTFFIEYDDRTYQTISFAATLRTTMYRYINRVAKIVSENNVVNVYLVTEMVSYTSPNMTKTELLQLNYREREKFRTKTLLTFYKITATGDIIPVMFDANDLVNRLSISVALGRWKTSEKNDGTVVMLTPIVNSFTTKINAISTKTYYN